MELQELKIQIDSLKSENLSLGYNELNFATSETLSEFQLGYSIDSGGKSLTGEKDGDWNKNWIVISTDDLGDPHFVDLKTSKVYSAMHGQGDWEADLISISLKNYIETINFLFELSKNRDNPNDLEKNPLTQIEIEKFEKFINEINNGEVEFYVWENWTENE
jgi:hypothetical protein